MTKKSFKVGDAVKKWYDHLGGYTKTVFFIRAMDEKNAQLAQECHPMNHFDYASISELSHAEFTKASHKDLHRYIDRAIIASTKAANDQKGTK